ncbi:hypothetical protein [Bradyrhizobium ottawaense]|uniref:hypothetical protein n=1 Tax=Bradyrhizobium ottawaense TaxID=931866 RepID=UPI001BA72662|nr:hypothetical protein [Bradyrhizobium ottawaense]
MKNPFRKSSVQTLETTIASLEKRGAHLAAMRVAAQTALEKAIIARQDGFLAGDLHDQAALDKLKDAADAAASSLSSIDDAIAALSQHKTTAEHQLTVERERIKRAAAADKLVKQIAGVEAALPCYLSQSRNLAGALSEISHFHFESSQIASFIQDAMSKIEIAANFALSDLKAMSHAIREGHQTMPGETTPAVAAVEQRMAETQTVFMLRSTHYRDNDGRKRFAGQWEDATMPEATAQRALDRAIAVPLTDPRRAQLRGMRGGDFDPKAADVIDLDAVAAPTSAATRDLAIDNANFTVIDRSAEARTIQIEVSRT